VDVKNTHPDGSIKMAVLSFERPSLNSGASIEVMLEKAPAPVAQPAVLLPAAWRTVDALDAAFPAGPPSLVGCARFEVTHPGVVDHNVDATILGKHAIGQGLHAVSIADIGEDGQRAHLLSRRVQHTGLNVGDDYARTLAHQRLGNTAANARSTPRDHSDQTVKRSDARFTHAHASHELPLTA
jgi:hypothetical protein